MTDAELKDKLFVAYGLITGPETLDELEINEIVERNVDYAFRLMLQLRVVNPTVRTMIINHVTEKESE